MPEREERQFPLSGPDQISPERFTAPYLQKGAITRSEGYVGGMESQPFSCRRSNPSLSCYDMAVHALA
jgi:hypothetical protein